MNVRTIYMLAALFTWGAFAAEQPDGKELFNGKDLQGWKETDFGGQGETTVTNGMILTAMGASLSGVQYTNSVPTNNFVISLETMKVDGSDFFCGLTFPVMDAHCSLIVGGWGGGVVGLSSVDSLDASENETTKFVTFGKNKWYKLRVEVRTASIKVFLDGDKVIDQETKDRRIGLRPGSIELQVPLGLCTYQTTAAWRNIRLAPLPVEKP